MRDVDRGTGGVAFPFDAIAALAHCTAEIIEAARTAQVHGCAIMLRIRLFEVHRAVSLEGACSGRRAHGMPAAENRPRALTAGFQIRLVKSAEPNVPTDARATLARTPDGDQPSLQ